MEGGLFLGWLTIIISFNGITKPGNSAFRTLLCATKDTKTHCYIQFKFFYGNFFAINEGVVALYHQVWFKNIPVYCT